MGLTSIKSPPENGGFSLRFPSHLQALSRAGDLFILENTHRPGIGTSPPPGGKAEGRLQETNGSKLSGVAEGLIVAVAGEDSTLEDKLVNRKTSILTC